MELKETHVRELAKRNAERALTGEDLIREDAKLPPKPYLHVFIPAVRLREMVREAMRSKLQWEGISKGDIKFADLPILKILKPGQ